MNELSFHSTVVSEPTGQAGAVAPRALDEPPLLIRYLNVVKRWKWLLVGAVAVAVTIGLVTTLLMTRQYTASATLEIRRESDRIVNVEGVQPEARGVDMEFYDTQWGLLRSPSLAERVAVQLRLHEDAAFFDLFGETDPAEELQTTSATRASAQVREKRIREAGKILLENVTISPDRRSRLVQVMFTSPDPSLSMRVANAWGDAFIETSLERRFEATSYARRFLEGRLEQLRERLQDSERVLVAYAANQRIINIPTATTNGAGGSGSTERPIVAEDLSILNRELNDATAARIAAQARLRGNGSSATEALTNQAISELRAQRAILAGQYAQLIAQFEPDYPPAQAMVDQIAEIDRSIAREEARVRESPEQRLCSRVDTREHVAHSGQ
jgi:uncharacterized protein involved in exopolysaccharide biosynthesis